MQKFVRQRVRKYGLSSQRKMLQSKSLDLLKENGFVVTDRNKNCLYLHNSRESMKHFIVKAIVLKILRERGRDVATEVETSGGVADVLDIDNRIVYEIETKFNRRRLREKISQYACMSDLFIICTDELPDDLRELEHLLKNKIV